MDVSSVIEAESVAVVGGRAGKAFGMLASAHSVRALSDTLYKDKERAVAREVICNAHDAHVMGGVDRSIEVKLTDNLLEVRDFGSGIPPESFESVYTVYFFSMKSDDKRATGGFGLGCKSPFAITEHFMVTNRYAGKQYTYAIMIGDEDAGGLPSSKLMSTVPTTETGVTVSIPLSTQARSRLQRIIPQVVYEGDMNVILNDEVQSRPDYQALRKQGFGVIYPSMALDKGKVVVLLGTVTYPIDTSDPLIAGLKDEIIALLGLRSASGYFVLSASEIVKPQPSREGLSYSEATLTELAQLMRRALRMMKEAIPRGTQAAFASIMKGSKLTRNNCWKFGAGTRERYTSYYDASPDFAPDVTTDVAALVRSHCSNILRRSSIKTPIVRKLMNKHFPRDRAIATFKSEAPSVEGLIYNRRILLRLAAKHGVSVQKLYFHTQSERPERLAKARMSPYSPVENRTTDVLIFADNLDRLKGVKQSGLVVSHRFPDDDAKLAFMIDAEARGLTVIHAEPFVMSAERRAELDERKALKLKAGEFFVFRKGTKIPGRTVDQTFRLKTKTKTTKPTSFVAPTVRRLAGDLGLVWGEHTDYWKIVLRRFPQAVVAMTAADCKTLTDLKIKTAQELMIDEAERRLKTKRKFEFAYHKAAALGHFGYYSNGRALRDLVGMSRRVADCVLGIKHVIAPERDESLEFWIDFTTMFYRSYPEFGSQFTPSEELKKALARVQKMRSSINEALTEATNALDFSPLAGFVKQEWGDDGCYKRPHYISEEAFLGIIRLYMASYKKGTSISND